MTSNPFNQNQLWLSVAMASDEEAFCSLLSTMLRRDIDASYFVHGDIVENLAPSGMVSTEVSVSRAKSPIEMWPYSDPMPIQYSRVNVGRIVDWHSPYVRVDLPCSKQEAMATYLTDNGLYDRSEQFVDGRIENIGNVDFTVLPGQVMIEGTATIEIRPFQRAIDDVLTVKTIRGFRNVEDMASVDDIRFLFDQLVAANPSIRFPLDFDDITFGEPRVGSAYSLNNTIIPISMGGEGSYIGDSELVYTRHDFGWYLGGVQPYMEGPSLPTTEYMIAEVARQTGFPITMDDVVVEEYYPIEPGELETVTVFFKPESLRYAGELTIDYRAV